jgi:isocitrate lyase
MLDYKKTIEELNKLKNSDEKLFKNINSESAARMKMQNRFQTGVDIAKYTAAIMREDMDAYDKDSSLYTHLLDAGMGLLVSKK